MIPKIIHYTWLSNDPFPKRIQACIDSWHKHLKGYVFRCWTLSDFDAVQHPWVHEAFQQKKYAYAADYIRFYALNLQGGIYLDADVEVLKPLDPLLIHKGFMGFEGPEYLEAAVIGAEANAHWVQKCYAHFKDQHFISASGSLKMITLPQVIKPILEHHFNAPILDTGCIQMLNGLTLYPQVYFSPKSQLTLKINITRETYTIHHFEGSWFSWSVKLKRSIKKIMPLPIYLWLRRIFMTNND